MPENKVYLFNFIEGCPAQNVTLSRGKYLFEAWGASGGGEKGGLGGYTSGYLSLYNTKTFFIYVGGEGSKPIKDDIRNPGGCNGGGEGGSSYNEVNPDVFNSGGGVGATDIRLTKNSEYKDRILVAAGGGGQCSITNGYGNGGYGGGLNGGNSTGSYKISKGATQTSGNTLVVLVKMGKMVEITIMVQKVQEEEVVDGMEDYQIKI